AASRDRGIRVGETAIGKAAAERTPIQIADTHKDPSLVLDIIMQAGFRALLTVPLLRSDQIIGAPVVRRKEPGEFPEHTVKLLQVLDLSKIEAGQLALELSEYCIQDIAQTVRSTLEPLAADKKLGFKVEMSSELPPGHGDGRRLTQVLINLVGNAIKFTDAGEVAIKAEANNGSFH